MQSSDGVVSKEGIGPTHQCQVVAQVLGRFREVHGCQLVACGDTMVERRKHVQILAQPQDGVIDRSVAFAIFAIDPNNTTWHQ